MKFKIKPRAAIALFIALLLVVDQVVKIWVKTHMTLNESITVFRNWFFIRFIENPGAAYGMELGGDYGKLILSLFRLVAIVLLCIYINRLLKKGTTTRGMLVGLSLVIAGAIGNVIDSAFYGIFFTESTFMSVAEFTNGGGYASFLHGKVVDMLYFPIIKSTYPAWFPWVGGEPFEFFSPIFNIADSYISVGVLYLIIFQRKAFLK